MEMYDFDDSVYEDHKPDGSDLLTQFDQLRWNAETLSMKSIYDVQIPLCGFLNQLTSTDCLKLIKYVLEDCSNQNLPSAETMLLNYLITDYISCGLSSPGFFVEFHKTLPSNKSKLKLLKDLITIWYCLFKSYKITSLNVEFVKRLTVILNRVFAGLSNLIPDFNIACQWNRVVDKINHNIRVYEVNILNKQVCFNNSSDINIQANNLLKEKDLSNKNKIPKKTCYSNLNMNTISLISQQKKPKNQNMESLKRVVLDTENIKIHGHQQYNSEQLAYNYQPKIPKLMTVDEENANPDPKTIMEPSPPPEQKLNIFQLMMLNAKKLRAKGK